MSVAVLVFPAQQLVDNKGELGSHLYELNECAADLSLL